jgi:type 1 glutamine amidotransferase
MHRLEDDQRKQILDALPGAAPAKPSRPRRLLVTNLHIRKGQIGGGHRSIEAGNFAIQQMGRLTGAYTAFYSDDPAMLSEDSLALFDAVCFNNTTGVLTEDPALKASLLGFIRNGGGFVGLHAAVATFCEYPRYDQFPEFGRMLGAYENGGHPYGPRDTVVVTPEDAGHPLNAAFGGKDFEIQDELFQMKDHYSRDRLRVLLRINQHKMDFGSNPRLLPERRVDSDLAISWVRREEHGRVFYTVLGHGIHTFWNQPVLKHMLAGIQFALGDLEADTTPRAMPD